MYVRILAEETKISQSACMSCCELCFHKAHRDATPCTWRVAKTSGYYSYLTILVVVSAVYTAHAFMYTYIVSFIHINTYMYVFMFVCLKQFTSIHKKTCIHDYVNACVAYAFMYTNRRAIPPILLSAYVLANRQRQQFADV